MQRFFTTWAEYVIDNQQFSKTLPINYFSFQDGFCSKKVIYTVLAMRLLA